MTPAALYVALNAAAGAPEWIKLLPAGPTIETHDGRGPYRVTNLAQLARESLAAAGGKLAIDENHSTDLAAPEGRPAPARGWIVGLAARGDGLWGHIEWTAEGSRLVADRAYRGISPVIMHDADGHVLKLLRASLTNTPNLRGMAALHQSQPPKKAIQNMLVTHDSLDAIFTGYKILFSAGLTAAPSLYRDIAMIVPSTHREETYAWLGEASPIREWIGPRHVTRLAASGYTIKNKKFEKTISVSRDDIEDDRIGVFGPMFEKLGRDTAMFPDEQIFGLLGLGFTEQCYDGQNFFDPDHPVGMPGIMDVVSVSNMQAGDGPAWFLIDASQPIKPLIYQERFPFVLTRLDDDKDENVFLHDEYLYGLRGRSNVGFGLWQLAYASKAELNAENYEAARAAMRTLKNDAGKALDIAPTHIVVPPELEGAAMRLLNNGTRIVDVAGTPVAVQNEWANTAKPIVSPYLS